MKDTDWGWVDRELAGSEASRAVQDAVVYALEAIRKRDVSDVEEREAAALLVGLVAGHSITKTPTDEHWVPVIPGDYSVGATVRVRLDAFDGPKGQQHNGQRGRVTGVRDGFVRVLLDSSPSIDIQMHYSPENLERLR